MKNGIYAVKFNTPGDWGEGLLTIRDDVINGGDAHYLYQGPLSEAGGGVAGKLRVSQWKGGNSTVFGTTGNFDLDVTGQFDHGSDTLTGVGKSAAGQLQFTARRIAELV